jgi:hypothetical protein
MTARASRASLRPFFLSVFRRNWTDVGRPRVSSLYRPAHGESACRSTGLWAAALAGDDQIVELTLGQSQ